MNILKVCYLSVSEDVKEEIHELTVVSIELAEESFEFIDVLLTSNAFFSHLIEVVENFQQFLDLEFQ